MNLIDTSTTSPHYFYRKCIGTTNENLNFDIRFKGLSTRFWYWIVWNCKGFHGNHCSHWKRLQFHTTQYQKRVLNPLNPNIKIQIVICCPFTLEVVGFQCEQWLPYKPSTSHCQVFDLHRRIFFAFARVLDALDITSFWFF